MAGRFIDTASARRMKGRVAVQHMKRSKWRRGSVRPASERATLSFFEPDEDLAQARQALPARMNKMTGFFAPYPEYSCPSLPRFCRGRPAGFGLHGS
jgi:hypothetical protein